MSRFRFGFVLIGALTAVLAAGSSAATPAGAAVPQVPHAVPTVLWIGDSYPAGTGATTPLTTGYSAQAAAAMGWKRALDAQGGTGFTTAGTNPKHQSLPARLPAVEARANPTVVVVDAGRHDGDGQAALDAATSYINDVATYWPNATIVLVVPWEVVAPTINSWAPTWHSLYASLAASMPHTYVIDPVLEAWYPTDATANNYKQPAPNVHPNQAGHDLAAQRYVSDFQALGVH